MKLIRPNPTVKSSGLEELPGKDNYFIGKDPKKWRTNIATYAKVEYANVYPGVDLVYYGNQHQLEYDFMLAPAADPRQIEIKFNGPSRSQLDADGDLVLSIAGGQIIEHKPVMYQDIGGVRQSVSGTYELRADQTVGFRLGRHDHHERLTIDPSLVYSTYLGASRSDGNAIAVDSLGNAYVTGDAASGEFPTTVGALQTTSGGGGFDAFVSKLNSDGSALIYSTYLGGSGGDGGDGVAVDAAGNAYVTGTTSSTDFPTTPGAVQTTLRGANLFISKLNSTGSALIYSTYLGGTDFDQSRGIAVDSSGDAYVTGFTNSSDFPTTAGAPQTNLHGGYDAFVSKLNSDGTALIYSTYLGGHQG